MADVKNKKLNTLLKKKGLGDFSLVKANGYFFIAGNTDEAYDVLNNVNDTVIYLNSFNQQTPEQWVDDIEKILLPELNRKTGNSIT